MNKPEMKMITSEERGRHHRQPVPVGTPAPHRRSGFSRRNRKMFCQHDDRIVDTTPTQHQRQASLTLLSVKCIAHHHAKGGDHGNAGIAIARSPSSARSSMNAQHTRIASALARPEVTVDLVQTPSRCTDSIWMTLEFQVREVPRRSAARAPQSFDSPSTGSPRLPF